MIQVLGPRYSLLVTRFAGTGDCSYPAVPPSIAARSSRTVERRAATFSALRRLPLAHGGAAVALYYDCINRNRFDAPLGGVFVDRPAPGFHRPQLSIADLIDYSSTSLRLIVNRR